jgi:hypothetical protein
MGRSWGYRSSSDGRCTIAGNAYATDRNRLAQPLQCIFLLARQFCHLVHARHKIERAIHELALARDVRKSPGSATTYLKEDP